jgi:hypothetical protein
MILIENFMVFYYNQQDNKYTNIRDRITFMSNSKTSLSIRLLDLTLKKIFANLL